MVHLSAKKSPSGFQQRKWVLTWCWYWRGSGWRGREIRHWSDPRKKVLHLVWGRGDWKQFLLFLHDDMWWISEGLLNIWVELMKLICGASQGPHSNIWPYFLSLLFKPRRMIQILINDHRRSRSELEDHRKMKYFLSQHQLGKWMRQILWVFLEAAVKRPVLRQGSCFDEPLLCSIKAEPLATARTRYTTLWVVAITGVPIAVILEEIVFFFLSSWI